MMMSVRVGNIRQGLHPQEVVVDIDTNQGVESLVLHKRSLSDGSVAIGYPITEDGGSYLVELPQETTSGAWRVWVPKESVHS